ncbi:carboxypeptidase B-like [Branchiostoma floridae]|uniref:Carboxypeptidase B-like n=1 Tax=Branchiostoma floridae TaxID=7739 RepID=A0A9J7HL50_BRAFL|nr:carboxypeptidase B-like [Branchiostoma floridae]
MKAFLLLTTVFVAFAAKRFDGHQVLRIHPEHEGHLKKLVRLERFEQLVDFWKGPTCLSCPVDVRVPKNLLRKVKTLLEKTGMKYTVMVDDLQQSINMARSRHIRAVGFNFDDYNTYADIDSQLTDFATSYPSLASVFTIGTTYEGYYIRAIKVGSAGGNKPAVLLEGQLHARDWIVSATLMYNIKFLLEGYGNDSQITSLMDQVDFYFIPVTNVDGYVFTHTEDRMWKKTRSVRGLCFGVDANRNWDVHFGSSPSDDPCSDIYHGPVAFSEPETKAVRDLVMENSDNLKAYLSVHASGQTWMTPHGWTFNSAPDYEEQDDLAGRAVSAIYSVNGISFMHGTIANINGLVGGSSCDWAYTVAGIKYSYAIQLRDGFVLPADQIRPSADEFFAGLLVVAEQVAAEY